MGKSIGWLWLAGFFGLAVAADAQTLLSHTAGSQFDGTYPFVSSTKLTEMFTVSETGRMRPCPDWTAGPLTIARGQARVSSASSSAVHADFEGTVGSQGELAMQSVNPAYNAPVVRQLHGKIEALGQYARA
jgi:hypothetical protein